MMRLRLTVALPALATALVASARAAHADTMPQLDFANRLLVTQVIWGAVIFAVFYGLLSRWGLPKVASVLDMRAATIGADLEQARLAKISADHAVTELNAARKHAYAESQAAIAEATRVAKAQSEAQAAEQTARLDRQLADSESRIAASRSDAMSRLGDIATETAQAVIARLVGPGLSAQVIEHGRLHQSISKAMADHSAARG